MRYLLIFLGLVISIAYSAQIYVTNSNNGVTYSDAPTGPNSQAIPTPQGNVVQGNTVPQNNHPMLSNEPITNAKVPYTTFEISSPANNATIQNQPVIQVELAINPTLQEGDSIQIFMDGSPWGKPQSSTHFEFTAPARGTHVLTAKLFSINQTVIKESPSNTIYVHQAALGGSLHLQ